MKNSIYLAAVILSVPAFAQNPNPNQPPQSGQAQPPAARPQTPASTAPATTTERLTQGLSNLVTDYRLQDLPPAVQKTVREQSAGQEIADIDRETRTGRVVWEVEFEKDGQNTEIHIAEDGTLIQDSGLVGRTATARPGEPSTAVGTPAGTQTGRSALSMGTKWEDLPAAIQQKAMQYGGKEKIADIDRETEDGKVVYEIEFKREGRNLEIEFGQDGSILKSSDPAAAPVGASSAPGAGRYPTTRPGQPQTTQPTPPPSQQTPPSTQPRP